MADEKDCFNFEKCTINDGYDGLKLFQVGEPHKCHSNSLSNEFLNNYNEKLERPNVEYHAEIVGMQRSESQTISKRYVKSIDNDNNEELMLGLSNISINGGDYHDFSTYRCKSVSSLASTIPSKSTKVKQKCNIDDDQPDIHRFDFNGHKVVQISASLSSSSLLSSNGLSLARKLAYDQWLEKKKFETAKKKRELNEIEMKKKLQEEKLQQEKEERERRERENFLSWIDRKKDEIHKKKKVIAKKSQVELHLKELESRALAEKEIRLKEWSLKKEKEHKATKQQQELKLKEMENEKKKRIEESAKAFAIWRDKSKHRPRPATQGLLPHQQAKPAYVNPNPWIIDSENE